MTPDKAWFLGDTLEKNKRLFKIPVYQRNYDWTDVQCKRLFDDIMNAFHTDKKHFTGSIVYIKGDRDSSRLNEVMVIDGQQRITTLFILLKAVYDKAVELREERLIDELKDYLFNRNCEEEFKLKLKPIKTDNIQFVALMSGDRESMSKDSNIYKNYNLFIKLINEEIKKGNLLRDIVSGMKKLEIIELVLDKTQGDDPQSIFESINSTGLDLSLADLVRNYILMSDENQEYLYENFWQKLEQRLQTDNLAEFIITFLNFKLTESVTQSNAYLKFRQLFEDNGYTNETMLEELMHYSKYHALFIGRHNDYSDKINKMMLGFRLLDQSTIYIFLYSIFDDFENGIIDEDTLYKILYFFRTYCLRRIICEVPSNSLRGLFKTLYRRLFADNQEKMYEKLYSFFFGLRSKDSVPEDLEFKSKLALGNLYNKKKACKYLLGSIENENNREVVDISTMTIEHIMPQKENAANWVAEIGSQNYKRVYDTYLHTLGNLTITGYNTELGTKSFSEKKEIIRSYSHATKLNADILSQAKWNEDSIKNRARNLSDKVLSIFYYPEPLERIEGLIDDEKFTFDDMDLATGKKPASVSIGGEIIEVNGWAEMLIATMKLLGDLDIKLMSKLAENNFKIRQAERSYITYDETKLRRSRELGDTGIFFEINLSAKNILQFIKELLECYGLDKDDFYFTMQDD